MKVAKFNKNNSKPEAKIHALILDNFPFLVMKKLEQYDPDPDKGSPTRYSKSDWQVIQRQHQHADSTNNRQPFAQAQKGECCIRNSRRKSSRVHHFPLYKLDGIRLLISGLSNYLFSIFVKYFIYGTIINGI